MRRLISALLFALFAFGANAGLVSINGAPGATSAIPGGTADNGLGNLYVDTNGGTCTRASSPSTYVDAQACSSLNTAYAAASCGDVIRVKAGTYSSVTISETASGSACGDSNRITMRPALGATSMSCGRTSETLLVEVVNIPWIGVGPFGSTTSPDNLTLIGFNTRLGISLFGDVNNVTVQCFNGGAFIIGPSSSANDSDNVRVIKSDWGPCGSRSVIGECSHSGDDSCNSGSANFCDTGRTFIDDNFGFLANHVYIEDNVIHDFVIENGLDHWECTFNGGVNNLEVRRNLYYNCETNAFANPDGTETIGTWIFENNWFGAASPGNAALKWGDLNTVGAGTTAVIVRFNSFCASNSAGTERTPNMDTNGKWWFIGNIFGENYDGGMQEANYRYNLYLNDAGVDPTDQQITSLPYANTSCTSAANYHLSGSSMADGFVPGSVTNSGLATDIDGDARSAPRDAGADER